MVKKQSTKTSTKKSDKNDSILNVTSEIGRKELTAFSIGLILFAVALLLLISFTSYLYSGSADYDMLENPPEFSELLKGQFENACGAWGALAAYFFLNNCFGLASYIIPVFCILLGMRLMNVFRIRIIRLFILMALLMVWLSVTLSAITMYIPAVEDSFLNPGGNHGLKVVSILTALIGSPGLYGLLILFAIFYLIYISKKTVEYVRSVFRLGARVAKQRKAKEGEKQDDDSLAASKDRNTKDKDVDADVENSQDNKPESKDEEYEKKVQVLLYEDESERVDKEKKNKKALNDTEATNSDNDSDSVSQQIDLSGDDNKSGAAIPETGKKETTFEVTTGGEDSASKNGGGDSAEKASQTAENVENLPPYDPKLDLENYKYPTLDLLDKGEDSLPRVDMEEQMANKERIINVLHSFGVDITSIKATIGPTVTLYEITLSEGTRISKIRNLEDDIALNLAAEGIRIIAPIPGKGTIGIEVPNKKKSVVSMESILSSKQYQNTNMELPCALGKTITNEVFMVDLAKAPHLLVAGATGMGKSVGLNAIVTSLLYKKHPSELKIVMVDPKKVEFSIYSPIENHFLAKLEEEEEPIITDVQRVVKTLNSLCVLMDRRYDLLKKARVRNIKEYNAKFKERRLNPMDGHEFMPYVVVIIDEFGDLIMTAGKDIELPICRIAQLARAVGIHMIIATQRPTASIITGTIKANFPARISFKVSAMMDSRIILDRPGANQLIGRGDMLYSQSGDPVRVQCAFVDTPEVSRICSFISMQQSPLHALYLPEPPMDDKGGDMENTADMKHLDPLFAEAAKLIVSQQQGSTSMIQRKFSIGYNRAGRLMDQLEKAGVVGPTNGAKPREVLITDLITLDSLINSIG